MAKKNRLYFKQKWVTSYVLDEADYEDLFDSFINTTDDSSLLVLPSDTVFPITNYSASAGPGISNKFARGDHSHGSPQLPSLNDSDHQCTGLLPITKIDSSQFLDKQTIVYSNAAGTFIPQAISALPTLPVDNTGINILSSSNNSTYWQKLPNTIARYRVAENSFITASNTGATLTKTAGSFIIAAPTNVEILSASLYLSDADLNGATEFNFVMGHGCGDHLSYIDCYMPSFSVIRDESENRVYKSDVYGNFNVAANTLTLTNLPGTSCWVNISF